MTFKKKINMTRRLKWLYNIQNDDNTFLRNFLNVNLFVYPNRPP